MTINVEKKAYEAPKMTVVCMQNETYILCGSPDPFGADEYEDVDVGSIGTFGNDKA